MFKDALDSYQKQCGGGVKFKKAQFIKGGEGEDDARGATQNKENNNMYNSQRKYSQLGVKVSETYT